MTKIEQKQYDYLLKLLTKQPLSEIQLQSKCAEILHWFYPGDWKRLVCVHNNDRRANTSNIGIVPGASDTYWLQEAGKSIYIEFKFGENAKQSLKQIEWEQLCISLGHKYVLCYTEDDFWSIIQFKRPVISDILNLKYFPFAIPTTIL